MVPTFFCLINIPTRTIFKLLKEGPTAGLSNPCESYKLLHNSTALTPTSVCHHTGGLRDTIPSVSLWSSIGMGIHTWINCFEKSGDLEPIKIKTLFPKGLILKD